MGRRMNLLLNPVATPTIAALNIALAVTIGLMRRAIRRHRRRGRTCTFNAYRLEWEYQ